MEKKEEKKNEYRMTAIVIYNKQRNIHKKKNVFFFKCNLKKKNEMFITIQFQHMDFIFSEHLLHLFCIEI